MMNMTLKMYADNKVVTPKADTTSVYLVWDRDDNILDFFANEEDAIAVCNSIALGSVTKECVKHDTRNHIYNGE